jgi:hypothetical protein
MISGHTLADNNYKEGEKKVTDYLLLLKISPGKIIDVLNALRSLPDKPNSGVDLNYTMNIFGTWDVGLWFNADNASHALYFVHKRVKGINGVVDTYTVPTFPHGGASPRSRTDNSSADKPEKNE